MGSRVREDEKWAQLTRDLEQARKQRNDWEDMYAEVAAAIIECADYDEEEGWDEAIKAIKAEREQARQEIAELKAVPFARVIAPYRNLDGDLCMTCDGTWAHEHGCVECSRCGKQGLRENWPFKCCIDGARP